MTSDLRLSRRAPSNGSGGRAFGEMREVFRDHVEFRRLFFSRYASLLGDWFNLLAVLALLRELGQAEPSTIGTVIILKLLPTAVAGPLAGVSADRLNRKALMIAADALRFGLVLALFAAPWVGGGATLLIYTVTALQTTAQAFAEPARLASLPNVVPGRLLGAANALSAVTWSLTFTLGAGLGGVVTSLLGWRVALGLDAFSYVASIALVARLALPEMPARPPLRGLLAALGVRDVLEALAYLRRQPQVASILVAKTGWGFAGAITLLLTLYGERVYPIAGRPDLGIAALYVARGLGTALGPIVARRVTRERDRAMRRAIGAAFLLAGASYTLFAGVSWVPVALLAVGVAHVGGSTIWVFSTVLLQRAVPDALRGRVFATELGLCTAAISFVTWLYGTLLEGGQVGLRPLTLILAGTIVLSGVAWTLAQTATTGAHAREGGPGPGTPGGGPGVSRDAPRAG
jgi:predicted MFS family arabinose efflux permease